MLHELGANVKTPNKDDATPVFIAAQNGHGGGEGVHSWGPTSRPDRWPTPSSSRRRRATGGGEGAGRLGANAKTPNKDGDAGLRAAQEGHGGGEGAARAGANVKTPDKNGWTVVYIVAGKGHVEVERALRELGSTSSLRARWRNAGLHGGGRATGGVGCCRAGGQRRDLEQERQRRLFQSLSQPPSWMTKKQGHEDVIKCLINATKVQFINSVTHSLIHSSRSHSLTLSVSQSVGQSVSRHSLTHSLAHSLTHSLTHSPTRAK